MDIKKLSILGQLGIGGGMGGVLSGITGGNPMMGAIGSIITGGNSQEARIQTEEPAYKTMPVKSRDDLLISGGWMRPSCSGPMTDAEYLEGQRIINSMPTGPAKELRQIRLFQQFLRSTV